MDDDDLSSRAGAVIALTDAFCAEHLNAGHGALCRRIVVRLAARTPSPLSHGHPETWAAGVILAGARYVRDEVIVVPPLDDAIVEVRRAPALVKQRAGE